MTVDVSQSSILKPQAEMFLPAISQRFHPFSCIFNAGQAFGHLDVDSTRSEAYEPSPGDTCKIGFAWLDRCDLTVIRGARGMCRAVDLTKPRKRPEGSVGKRLRHSFLLFASVYGVPVSFTSPIPLSQNSASRA